jgi:hypothetical protein
MANEKAKQFLVKNKKALYIAGGTFVVLGSASYLLFGYKGKDGKTVFGRWKQKRDEDKIVDAVKSDVKTVKDLLKNKGGIIAERI